MKPKFSCLAILLTMLLFGASESVQAMGAVAGAGERVLVEGIEQSVVRSTAQAAAEGLTKLGRAAEGVSQKLAAEAQERVISKFGGTLTKIEMEAAFKAEMDVSMKAMTKSLSSLSAESIGKLTSLGAAAADDIAKLGSTSLKEAQVAVDEIAAKTGMTRVETDAMKQSLSSSKGILNADRVGVAVNDLKAKTASFADRTFSTKTLEEAERSVGMSAREAEATLSNKAATAEAKYYAREALKEIKYATSSFGGKALKITGSAVGTAGEYTMYALATISAAVLFMLPSIFESAFLAQQSQNAMLQTYIPPIKFGNIVMQMPDSVINVGNPTQSQFIYYGIPVNNPGEKLSAEAAAAHPGVSGPTAHNKISSQVNNDYARAFTMGKKKGISIPRYNLDASALATLPIFVSYSDQTWNEWGSNGIPDAAFSQMLINLNTGYIFYADGTSQGTAAAPLIGPKTNGPTVQSFIGVKHGKLGHADAQANFTQYVDSFSSSKAGAVAPAIVNQFDCSCLENNNSALSQDTVNMCAVGKNPTCLLTSVLNQLSAGLVINADGKVMRPDQTLEQEVAKGALGQVIPIQGLGKDFDKFLQMFPGAQQDAIAHSGAFTINVTEALSDASSDAAAIQMQGAAPDNYSAKGVYVYQCKNTPLAKMLRKQASASWKAPVENPITDFIIFLDSDLNPVPMMTPAQDPHNYNFITMGLNPVIKYVSTIIGTLDANGGFSFIPQANIQSTPALIAKGLPASFAPLYGIKAQNGSLSVNYNQNLSGAVGPVVQALLTHGKLGEQFKNVQLAMLRQLAQAEAQAGYGKYKLKPVDPSMQLNISGVNLMLYTGFNGYPVSQDAAHANCSDLLIPLSAEGKTLSLPSNNVAQYYGLVTDLTYTVDADGTITVGSDGFANSPLSQSYDRVTKKQVWNIDPSEVSKYYWITKLTSMGMGSNKDFTMPQPVIDFVTKARTAWIDWIKAASAQGVSASDLAPVTLAGTSTVLTIANQQAAVNGLCLYTCKPCPSSGSQDYFVLTNSSSPQASDASLGKLSASSATAATNLLSVMSGLLYTSSGAQVKNSSGAAYSVDALTLLQTLDRLYPKGFSDDLKVSFNIALHQSAFAAQAIVYPFQFGGLQLGIYQADLNNKVYLYINAAGAGTSLDFKPSDYFVTVDSYTSPNKMGMKLDASTQYLVSLVSGQVYGSAGVVANLPAAMVATIVGKVSAQWRPGIAAEITALTTSFVTMQKTQREQSAQMDAATSDLKGVTLPQSSVVKIITELAAKPFLQIPYNMLKQDSASGAYVIVSPANADRTEFAYTFFDVPNSLVDAKGNAMHLGAMYDNQGNLLRTIQGAELVSMLHQYGVALDKSGKQSLGASNVLPMMFLDPADLALQPGVSGKSMIYSNDSTFPVRSIVSPIAYQDSKFYIYYNTIMQGYYAMQVRGSVVTYIDMAGGNVYNLDGSACLAYNPVAVNSNGDAQDLLLPYVDLDSFTTCVMKNNGLDYSDFYNSVNDFQPFANDVATNNLCGLNSLYALEGTVANVKLAQMPFPETLTAMPDLSVAQQYNVYWNQATPTIYKVDATYQWQNLQLLPISMKTGALLNPLPADMYMQARLVMNPAGMYGMIFAGKLYTGATKISPTSYSMMSGKNKITVSMKLDTKTSVQYVEVVAGSAIYNYQCTFLTLSDSQLLDYRHNAWKAQTTVDVTGKILLEEYLPVDGSGNVQLSAVGMSSVINVPSDAAAKTTLLSNLGTLLHDTVNGRFIAPIDAAAYPYFKQNGYVDIENGVLFDSKGLVAGYCLQITDLIELLQQLSIAVVRDGKGTAGLRYNQARTSPDNVKVQRRGKHIVGLK